MKNNSMQISHEDAMQLIQFQADHALHGDKQKTLNEHLTTCAECRRYAQQLNQLENILKNVMHSQWDLRPAPLSITALIGNNIGKKYSRTLLITRTALISMALLAFVVIGWQFTDINTKSISETQFAMLPIPTPSTQITATSLLSNHCVQIHYHVQKNDTLESIAAHFAISEEMLMKLNSMSSKVIQPNTELVILVCDTTPTKTLPPPTFTITPILDPTASTPG
jgi:hypothetical protein